MTEGCLGGSRTLETTGMLPLHEGLPAAGQAGLQKERVAGLRCNKVKGWVRLSEGPLEGLDCALANHLALQNHPAGVLGSLTM